MELMGGHIPYKRRKQCVLEPVKQRIKARSKGRPVIVMAQLLSACPTLFDPWTVALPGSCTWDFPGKNTRVGYFLLRIFLTREPASPVKNPGRILYN